MERRKMRVCIICRERNGNDFLSASVYGCVEQVGMNDELDLGEHESEIVVKINGEKNRYAYRNCNSCKYKVTHETCIYRAISLTPKDYTGGYCTECSQTYRSERVEEISSQR